MVSAKRKQKSPPNKLSALKKALQEKTRELDLLRQISDSISYNLDLDSVVRQVIDIVVQVTQGT